MSEQQRDTSGFDVLIAQEAYNKNQNDFLIGGTAEQQDVLRKQLTLERRAAEGELRNAMIRKLLNMDLAALQKLRKLIDENFKGPPKAGEFSAKSR